MSSADSFSFLNEIVQSLFFDDVVVQSRKMSCGERPLIKFVQLMKDYIKEISEGLFCKPSLSYNKRLWKYKQAISSAIYLLLLLPSSEASKVEK